jgi:hypothetical protein
MTNENAKVGTVERTRRVGVNIVFKRAGVLVRCEQQGKVLFAKDCFSIDVAK